MGVDLIWRSVALEKFSDQTVAQSSLRGKILLWTKLSCSSIARTVSIKHRLRTTDYGLRTGYKTRTEV